LRSGRDHRLSNPESRIPDPGSDASHSKTSRSRTFPASRFFATSPSPSIQADASPLWARPVPARRRSSACCCGSTTCRKDASQSVVSISATWTCISSAPCSDSCCKTCICSRGRSEATCVSATRRLTMKPYDAQWRPSTRADSSIGCRPPSTHRWPSAVRRSPSGRSSFSRSHVRWRTRR